MEIMITAQHTKLTTDHPEIKVYTGNTNVYHLNFNFSADWDGLNKFVVFLKGSNSLVFNLESDKCAIPQEALEDTGYLSIGVFATNGSEENYIRLSSSLLTIYVDTGAYHEGVHPEVPAPGIWEEYLAQVNEALKHAVPYIGDNYNWYVWDVVTQSYVDSGVSAVGEGSVMISVDNYLSLDSENPVQNKIVTKELNDRLTKETMDDYIDETRLYKIGIDINSEPMDKSKSWYTAEQIDGIVESIEDTIYGFKPVYAESMATNVSDIMGKNADTRYGTLVSLTILQDEDIDIEFKSELSFYSGNPATVFSNQSEYIFVGDDVSSDGIFTPQPNTWYELSAKFIGRLSDGKVVVRVGATHGQI